MFHWKFTLAGGLCAGLVAGAVALSAAAEDKKEAKSLTIKQVMGKFHKGEPAICGKAAKGKATEAELKAMLAAYNDMCAQTPPKGEADSWKEKCTALINATKGLIEMKDGAPAAFQAAVNCKGCHEAHKPPAKK